MSYANIVHNYGQNYGVVIAEKEQLRKMMYCIFHNNQDYLFCVWEGSLEVSHSFISHSGSLSTEISISTATNNTFSKRNTYQFTFFSSLYCNADFPLPQRTLMETVTLNSTPINENKSNSSSLEMDMKPKREENRKKENNYGYDNENDSKRDQQKNSHHDYISRPYVF